MKVRLTFTEECLGTASADPQIHKTFIAANAPDAKSLTEEIEAIGVDAKIEKSMTVFPRNDNGQPILWDYQVKGFFKDACSMLARAGNPGKDEDGKKIKGTLNESCKISAYKKVIDGVIFVLPRKILLKLPPNTEIGHCERPLRAQTAQGERIALANSETIPAGTTIDFEISCLDTKLETVVKEWLDYGKLRGIGQWRNSGKGRFTWTEIS